MADYLNEDSFCSWHTCQEENQYTKPSNENIIKDFNLNIDDSDEDSIKEFQQIIDTTDAFNNFKNGNNSDNDFLRPSTPNRILKKDNSPILSNILRPKYLSFNNEQLQQNVSLADKTTPYNNVNIVENSHEIPSFTLNDEKVSNIFNISDVKFNILSENQTSSMTLIDSQNQDIEETPSNISIPEGTLSNYEKINAMLPPSGKSHDINENTKNNLENKKENIKDDIENKKENIKDDIENKKENIKDDIENIKNNIEISDNKIKDDLSNITDNIKDNMEDTKEIINDGIKNVKESTENIKMNTTEKINKNNVVDDNNNENTGTLGRLFSYFKGFGKYEINENVDNKEDKAKEENEINTIQKVTDVQNLKPPVLIAESSSLTMVDNDEYDDSEFVNAYDGNYNENSYENHYDDNFSYNNKIINENNDKNEIENENEDDVETEDEDEFENAIQEVSTNINNNQQNINSQEVVVEETVVQSSDNTGNVTNKISTYVNKDDINNINNNEPLPTIINNNMVNNNYYDNKNDDHNIIDNYDVNINNNNNNNIIDNNKFTDDNIIYDDDNENENDNNIINNNNNNNNIENNSTQNEVEDDESEATTDDFQDAITSSYVNININESQYSSQYISKIHPMALSDKEGTIRIINPLVKKGSSNTLKAQPINIELVPVHKPISEVGDYNCTFDSFKTGIQESRIMNEEYDNNILPNEQSNKILKKKHKKRKWYKKIFRLAICKKHDDV
ncbi:hypothetical protein BCR32DRAFT_271470 [Anaeromyces robustus]|uniref:Uncharacterized protein n=1 Tax=Anaeromyces robustus TaxID=1754192 RepID=A0A1Y1WRD8_9FUNG|nr:hypothetical protein BCR32DRAFT_271470 [Anaeromyces robustus]|eukprot:ORX76097.1 hypothetical protein BCR32DRAFT_271470 [Anaeromyces robustus]